MNIAETKQVMLRTHLAAIRDDVRASCLYLEGMPGVGKSDGTEQYAKELAKTTNEPVGLVIFMLATISSVDVKGFMLPQKNADGRLDSVFSTPPWYPTRANTIVFEPNGTVHREGTWAGEMPRIGILFLDEFGQAEDEVKKPAAELLYRGQVGTTHLPELWRVIAAGNRLSDRSGVLRELMFIVNRRCKLNVDARIEAWLEYANRLPPDRRPHFLTLSFAQKNPGIVFKDAVPAGSDPFCTPRTLCLLDKDLKALRSDADIKMDRLPTDPLAREVASGWIGQGEAAQFFTHLKYADELPDIADIEKDASKAKLPAMDDAQLVCAYMLAHHVNEKNAEALIAYITRLKIQMQVLAVKAITSQQDRLQAVLAAPGFIKWLTKHRALLQATEG